MTIRIKLTFAFAAAMSAVLAATGLFLYLRFADELTRTIDRGLRSQVQAVQALVAQTDTGLRESGRGLTTRSASFAQVLRGGRPVDYTPGLSRSLLDAAQLARAARRPFTLERRSAPGVDGPVRLLAAPVVGQDRRPEVAVVGVPLASRDHALGVLATLLGLGGAGALALTAAVGYALSTVALRTVESMRRRAQTLSVTDPGGRLPVPRARDELWRLSITLNEMLARNEAAFARERAFVADAGHELRTPLTILRAELEIALRAGTTAAEVRRAVAGAEEESVRLSRLADALLLDARADRGPSALALTVEPAHELLERVARRCGALATARGRTVTVERPTDIDGPAPLGVVADLELLERALINLVDNALRHGDGSVRLHAETSPGAVTLHVRDAGTGFPSTFLPTAFERFSRAEHGRSSDGSGVGLAIVASVARAHGGQAGAENLPDGGADAWITLPHGAERGVHRAVTRPA